MEKTIYDSKEKQNEREQSFVLNPIRLEQLDKIQIEIVEDIISRLKEDKHHGVFRGQYTTIIEFDSYNTGEYSIMAERIEVWNGDNNGVNCVAFYNTKCIPTYVPEHLKAELWDTVRNATEAYKLHLTYSDYLKKKDDVKIQNEIKKADEIEAAKKVLEKYNQ